ncbi:hypoxanthine phosphoribosyltransferase, partial [bacterium]|nr:hypoxanthine phosphoribosyltransferase [bacterium]
MSKIISLISKEEIAKKVEELADSISNDYKGGDLLVVGILKGAYIFMADLVRRLKIPVKCDFVKVSSYGSGAKSSGKI